MPKPRLVILDHSAQMSGAEIALLNTVTAMRKYEPVVVLAEDGPLRARLAAQGTHVLVEPLTERLRAFSRRDIRLSVTGLRPVPELLAHIDSLASLVLGLSPACVLSNSMKSHVYGAVVARRARVPHIAYVRDRVSVDFMSQSAVRMMRTLLATTPDGVIANSMATLSSVPSFFVKPIHTVIESPILPPAAAVTDYGERGTLTFGMVGRLTPWKGQELAIRAFSDAFPAGEASHRMRIIGGALFGEEAYAESLRGLVRSLGLDARVDFVGHVDDVYAEMLRLDALVHASVIPEPFGQVVAQGMAIGLPVVASGEGGPLEIIEPNRTGLLFRPRDQGDLSRQLSRLANDAPLRCRLGCSAREVATRYSPDKVAERLERFVDWVAARRAPAHE